MYTGKQTYRASTEASPDPSEGLASPSPSEGGEQEGAFFKLTMEYDNLHNITRKKQDMTQTDIQFAGMLKAGYDLSYSYNSTRPHQIQTLTDTDYRTEGTDDKDPVTKDHQYTYDANGNLISVNIGIHLSSNI